MNTSEDPEIIDLAEYAAQDKRPPKGHRYRFLLDKTPHVTDESALTGRQILAFGGMNPDQYSLFEAKRGGKREPIGADETVDLTEHGIERFFTMKKEHTNGDGQRRIEYQLPPDDLAYLGDLGYRWEAVQDGTQRWLVIRDWRIPKGLTPESADIALRIDPNYPMSQIDMAYFRPALGSTAGVTIPNLTPAQICGETWQQWSRHRPLNAWRPGVDSLESHLAFVDDFLAEAGGSRS
jgi:hypothetical protein